jgi:hypothetical protein
LIATAVNFKQSSRSDKNGGRILQIQSNFHSPTKKQHQKVLTDNEQKTIRAK